MALNQANASVPAENCIIVACRAKFLRLLVAPHRLFQKDQQGMGGTPGAELRLGPSFVQNSHVVEPLVGIREALKRALSLQVAVRGGACELIRDGQAESP